MTNPPLNLHDFEALAQARLDPAVYAYYAGGAEDEVTLRANRVAFERLLLRPRVMVDVGRRSPATTVLGARWGLPVGIAPTALAGLAHPDGEIGIARAAGAFGVPAILSTFSTTALEDVARAATGPLWFQLYVYRDRAITRRLVERAEACGYQALVLTVDVPVTGKRERDRRAPLALPPGVTLANFAEFALDRPELAGETSALIAYAQGQLDPSLTWEALEWLRGITAMPIWVKGVLRGDDAAEALAHGAAGVIVSNHGGRQLDGATASLSALPEVVAAVGGRGEVLLDGGVRRGADIVRALALGARAVLVGRPALWALAHDGEAGVRLMLDLLRDEFDRALALCGCRAPGEVTGSLIAPRDSGAFA